MRLLTMLFITTSLIGWAGDSGSPTILGSSENQVLLGGRVARISISGTATGGSLEVQLPPQNTVSRNNQLIPLPNIVLINTVAGETAAQVAQKLRDKINNTSAMKSLGTGNNVELTGYFPGQIGLKSTDTGIETHASVQNLTAVKELDNSIKISWDPVPATTTLIFIYRGDKIVGRVNSTVTQVKDVVVPIEKPTGPSLLYRVISMKGHIPSEDKTVSIANPFAN